MELLETEGTGNLSEFPDQEPFPSNGDIESILPEDAIIETDPPAPVLPLPEDGEETAPSDGEIPEESSEENPGEITELPSEDDTSEKTEEVYDTEKEHPVSVSGNDIVTISGNAVIFPEDFDFSMFSGNDPGGLTSLDALIEAETFQTEVICGVSVGIMFLLGVIAGILLIHGFRLRRV